MKKSGVFRANLLYYSCKIVGFLPWWFLYYFIAEFIYLILYYIVRYRIKVTRENLRLCFPDKTVKKLRKVERRYYRHLAEVFVDTIDLAGISAKAIKKRIEMVGEKELRENTEGKDWIAATSHYGSWEYFMFFALGNEPQRELLGVYRPLKNKPVNLFYKKVRTKFGMVTVPMNTILRHIITDRSAGKLMTIGLLTDQTPPRKEIEYWFDFLGRPTPFFVGMEKIAQRFGMPVYFMRTEKVKKAHYKLYPELIWDGKEQLEPYELTKRYVARLEEIVREKPEYWVWSHRRWKHKPRPGEMEAQAQFKSRQYTKKRKKPEDNA